MTPIPIEYGSTANLEKDEQLKRSICKRSRTQSTAETGNGSTCNLTLKPLVRDRSGSPYPGQKRSHRSSSEVRSRSPHGAVEIQCTANGKRPQESNFFHCPIPQSFVRCGPHHRARLKVLDNGDVDELYRIWRAYRDDLSWPWYEKKPLFAHEDYLSFREIAEKVVNAMVAEYKEPMVLDQATISNTNHKGHPPHADNVQFDSVWWEGKKIKSDDEITAARDGAYVLWRPEKTSYRSYACTVALSDPNGYEGGEVQFFANWGDKTPTDSVKCNIGEGVAFCGCQRNIHAVTGVRSGFRLVLLVWTRPPNVRVPDSQSHVCYFRPGTGRGVWLTTADQQKLKAPKRERDFMQSWVPREEEYSDCKCEECLSENKKLSWRECQLQQKTESAPSTPSTSAGGSPRTCECQSSSEESPVDMLLACPQTPPYHCPKPQGLVRCGPHKRVELQNVLSKADVDQLHTIWYRYQDDLTRPWYDKKPKFTYDEFLAFRNIAQKVVHAMEVKYDRPLVLDQATVSRTNDAGHSPHADNVQFDSVWWNGKQIKQRDELVAARGGAEVLWRSAKTSYRNYSASVALTSPSEYTGGDLEFFSKWGDKDPCIVHRPDTGSGIAICGCQENIHAVTGVKWGFRLVLLVWTRPADGDVANDQAHVCYYRPGTGMSIWLTSADLQEYPQHMQQLDEHPSVNELEENQVGEKTNSACDALEIMGSTSDIVLPPSPPSPSRSGQ